MVQMTDPRQDLINRIEQAEKEVERRRLREELRSHDATSIDWLGLWAQKKTVKETAAKHGIPYQRARAAHEKAWSDATPAQVRKAKMQRASLGSLKSGVHAQFSEWEIPGLPIQFQIAYLEGCTRDCFAHVERAVWEKLHPKVRAQFEDKRRKERAALAKHLWERVRPLRQKYCQERRETKEATLARLWMWADDVCGLTTLRLSRLERS